jgi:hypothetical protein
LLAFEEKLIIQKCIHLASFLAFSSGLLMEAHQQRAVPDMETARLKRPRESGDRRW